jgi:nitrite reductase/ring-hydroxylating ferredoxin subunit
LKRWRSTGVQSVRGNMIPRSVTLTVELPRTFLLRKYRTTGDVRYIEQPSQILKKSSSGTGSNPDLFTNREFNSKRKEISVPTFEIPGGNLVQEGGMGVFSVNGNRILLSKYKGKYYAINAICPHQGGDLSSGTLEGKNVICPRHGHKIDITSGNHAGIFQASFLKSKNSLGKSYRVIDGGDTVIIEM